MNMQNDTSSYSDWEVLESDSDWELSESDDWERVIDYSDNICWQNLASIFNHQLKVWSVRS